MIVGLGLVGDWMVRIHGLAVELAAGAVMLACAVPLRDGLTGGELLVVVLSYGARSHWTVVEAEPRGSAYEVRARGDTAVRGYELIHRGRLDLSGADGENAQRLGEMVIGLSMRPTTSHASVHVRSSSEGSRTMLALDPEVDAGAGWTENATLVREVIGLDDVTSLRLLERWSYLRTHGGLVRVMRVVDFSATTAGSALLQELQQGLLDSSVALHFDVVEAARAQRLAARAVHRMSSDGAASRAAGFRRTARSTRALERVGQREELVASGKALLRVGVYVTVRASSLDELRAATKQVLRKGEQSGLRIERGVGRQFPWYCFQLPGGPGW